MSSEPGGHLYIENIVPCTPRIVYMYMYLYVCMSIYVCMYACMHVCLHVSMYACTYVCVCLNVCKHVSMQICLVVMEGVVRASLLLVRLIAHFKTSAMHSGHGVCMMYVCMYLDPAVCTVP